MKIYICHIYSKYRFIEYIRSVVDKLDITQEIYYDNKNQINNLDFANDKFVVAQKIPFEDKRFTPENTEIINTEQLTRLDWNKYISKYIELGFKVYSYSLSDIIQKDGLSYLPYGHNKDEIDKLTNFMNQEIKYDVAFCGYMNNRRKKLLNQLTNKGLRVLILVDTWEDKRDEEIAKSRILLNIHFLEDYKVYESIRCDRWLMVGMPVISEESLYPFIEHHNLFWASYDNLVDKVFDVLKLNLR